jgi:uncharacterized protein (TIGR03067 family)
MRWVGCFLAVLVLALLTPGVRADKAKDDGKALEGKWKMVGGERSGTPIAEGDVPEGTITINKDGSYTVSLPNYQAEGTSRLDPAKKPKAMDVTYTKGPDKDKQRFGIYKLDGDQLTICVTPPDRPEGDRPTEFSTKDSENLLFVFKRVK